MKKDLENKFVDLEKKLEVNFKNKNLLIQAFIHRSYINENARTSLNHNERLEFLGDAVLELIATNYLYHKYLDLSEGELTNYRAALVNTNTLGDLAKNLNFNDYLFLSKGESKDFGRARIPILADTYESVIGAIFLDQNYAKAKDFVEKTLLIQTDQIIEAGKYKDAKSKIQEFSQEKLSVTPNYKVLEETGPDHDKNFVVGIYFKEEKIAHGQGRSKQEAETEAAKNALAKMNWGQK